MNQVSLISSTGRQRLEFTRARDRVRLALVLVVPEFMQNKSLGSDDQLKLDLGVFDNSIFESISHLLDEVAASITRGGHIQEARVDGYLSELCMKPYRGQDVVGSVDKRTIEFIVTQFERPLVSWLMVLDLTVADLFQTEARPSH